MNAERKISHKLADDRAHRIASIAAEELIRTEGYSTNGIDEYAIPQCQADNHMRECIAHLCWSGKAVSHETDEGYIVVQLGDFTSASLRDT